MSVLAAIREDVAKPARWPLFDGVRGVAVVAVVVYHAVGLGLMGRFDDGRFIPAVFWPIAAGRIALDVFFVMSGFLVVVSWQSLRRQHPRFRPALADYLTRRALRIVPLWWFSVLVLAPIVAPHLLASVRDVALLVTLQHYVVGDLHGQLNVVSWSLTTEWHFYLLVPLVVVAFRRLGAGPTLLLCLAVSVWWQLGGRGGMPSNLIPGRIDQFAAGAFAAGMVRAHDQGSTGRITRVLLRPRAGWAVGMALAAVAMYNGAVLGRRVHWFDSLMHPVIGLLVAALLVRWICRGGVRCLERPGVKALGTVSYSLYLWHFPLQRWVAHDLGLAADGVPVVATLAAMAVVSVLALGIACGTYVGIERRFLSRKAGATTKVAPGAGTPLPAAAEEEARRPVAVAAGARAA